MILLAIAAQLAAPEPKAIWFSANDNAIHQKERLVSFRTIVDPNGTIQGCEVERSSGVPKLDARVCQISMKRAQFHAARWMDGTPSYGVYRTHVLMLPPEATQSRLKAAANAVMTVNRLPEGLASPAGAGLLLAVDEQGAVSSCQGSDAAQNSMLVKIACAQAGTAFKPILVKDSNGAPVRSVQMFSVEFVKE